MQPTPNTQPHQASRGARYQAGLERLLAAEKGEEHLLRAIDRLARHRAGQLTSDEQALMAGRVKAMMPGMAAPSAAACITELLIEDIISAWRAM